MIAKVGHRIRSLSVQEIEYLVIISLIGFVIVFSYLLYIGNNEDRARLETIIQQQGNSTREQRIALDQALADIVVLVPELEKESDQMLNATNEILKVASYFEDDFIEDQGRLYSQANYTKERVDRMNRVFGGDMRAILGTVLSLNNKLDQFIFTRPESNISSEAQAITNIEQLVNVVEEIRQIVNQTEVTAADVTINQTRIPKLNSTNMTMIN